MQTVLPHATPIFTHARTRSALVASADSSFRHRISEVLGGLRWHVRQARSGAEAWAEAESAQPEAMVVDSWLPDLELDEFLRDIRRRFPDVDLVTVGETISVESPRGPYRQELLYALRHSQDTDTAAWNTAPILGAPAPVVRSAQERKCVASPACERAEPKSESQTRMAPERSRASGAGERIPELIGNAGCMLEVSRRIRLVAPRTTPVLIEGPTGSGKELVAQAIHRLSQRSRKPFVAINCAAIPEALLEAELFGHTRGAFTGAVQGRMGRIESADGGTLFLDEIGEMPLGLQAKLLRFVECGELQRVGDNEHVKVDVRIVAATHQALAQQALSGSFRADLYYRLAVFLIRTPALVDHLEDLPLLVAHFVERMGREAPVKQVDAAAMAKLASYDWPGNVRELEHVLERGAILAGEEAMLTPEEIDFGLVLA